MSSRAIPWSSPRQDTAADRVFVLADGRVIESGPPEQVLDAPREERTREFLRNILA